MSVKFLNYYRCPNCKSKWTDLWSCACNDRCPGCNREIEPYKSDEIEGDEITDTTEQEQER